MPLNLNKLPNTANSDMVAPLLEVGAYPGRLVGVIDLGLHVNSFNGEEKPPAYRCRLTYELSDEFMHDKEDHVLEDKPRWMSEEINLFPLSSERATSTARYKVLDPQGVHKGDFAKCIGAPVMVTVVHNPNSRNPQRPYENVGGISPMTSKQSKVLPDLVNPPMVFELDNPDMEVFQKLPDFIKEKIISNLEFKGSALSKLVEVEEKEEKEEDKHVDVGDLDDEIPF